MFLMHLMFLICEKHFTITKKNRIINVMVVLIGNHNLIDWTLEPWTSYAHTFFTIELGLNDTKLVLLLTKEKPSK